MDQIEELDDVVSQSTEYIVPTGKRILFEDKNKITFTVFRALGFFPLKWDSQKGLYIIQPCLFISSYIFWWIWPLIGLSVALYGKNAFSLNDTSHVDEVIDTSVFILGFAVTPSILTYAIKLLTRYLPDILDDMASLNEMDIGFKTPMTVQMLKRRQNALISKEKFIDSESTRVYDKMLFYVPLATVVLSVVSFIAAWVYEMLVVDWSSLDSEWPFFVMQFTYLTQPAITTWLCIIFIEWQRMVYETLRVQFDNYYHDTLASLDEKNKPKKAFHPPIPLDEEKIKLTGDYVDKLQEIFLLINEGYMKYITSINFLTCLVSAVFCTLELLRGFHLIMYMIPLAIGIFHMGLFCYISNGLIDEYYRFLLVLKKLVRMERRNPALSPYEKIHTLRENLLDSPPQVTIFGGYSVGIGLFIGAQGFILSYAMLANDILDLMDNNSNTNSTVTMQT